MATIRAVTVDLEAPGRLTLTQVESPVPAANEALVRVKAISLNRGEVRGAQNAQAGERPGWDIAGLIERPAVDGSGPRTGRIVGVLRTGAWAELVAVPTTNLATIPDNVTFAQASTLPVAGLTALYALDRAEGLAQRNVLITGASGGVGNLGIQIAKQGGARVTGLVRQVRHAPSAKEAGADNVVADEMGEAARTHGPFNHVLESVGGAVLGNVLTMVALNGRVIVYGASAGGPVTVDSTAIMRSRLTMSGLGVFQEMLREGAAPGLERLARMVSAGTLKPHISHEASWNEIGEVATQFLDRAYPGKVVLHVD
jgi:NADPH:quinone reductase-like Zn-dependent oxidoreductase